MNPEKTNRLRVAAIALCALLLVLPSLAIPFFQSEDGGDENRYLADPPVLLDGDGLNADFDQDFEDWLRDHFAFRRQAVAANALLSYRLLRTSPSESVVAGRDGWLYYADTVPDYTGEGRLTEGELAALGDSLSILDEALASRGVRLYVAIVPNKSTIYPQYMPRRYPMRQDDGNIARMRRLCEERDIAWIDLLTPLRQAAGSGTPVYYRTDTHWNALGAAVAADAILDALGKDAADWTAAGETVFRDGDLARLMGLTGALSEAVPVLSPEAPLADVDFSQHRLSAEGRGEGTLLVYRDSFGTAVGPWLAQGYAQAELRWEYPLDATRPCDDALLLLCERNLREYLGVPPVTEEADDAGALDADGEDEFTPAGDGADDDDFFSDSDDSDFEAGGFFFDDGSEDEAFPEDEMAFDETDAEEEDDGI